MVILGAVISIVAIRILILKSEDGISQMQALYRQPEDSIDVLFLGGSLVYVDIDPGIMWDDYGIAGFDLGGAEAPPWVSYYHLKEAFREQKPKILCYEVSTACIFPELVQRSERGAQNNYGMKWNRNRVEQLYINSDKDDFRVRLNPYNIMHGRYNDIQKDDFVNERGSMDFKGFDPADGIMEFEMPVLTGTTEVEPCSEKAEKYIRKIINLARDEGCTVLLFSSPHKLNDHEEKQYNYIQQIADSEGVEFLDFNKKYFDIDMDFSEDLSDWFHLNYSGSCKFTQYLGAVLKSKYDIPDRRGDARYLSWDRNARLQSQDRNNLKIRMCEDEDEVLSLASDGYVLFMISDGIAAIFENNKVVALADADAEGLFRMTHQSGDSRFVFSEVMDRGIRMCSLFINDREIKREYREFLFIYDTIRNEYVGWKLLDD